MLFLLFFTNDRQNINAMNLYLGDIFLLEEAFEVCWSSFANERNRPGETLN